MKTLVSKGHDQLTEHGGTYRGYYIQPAKQSRGPWAGQYRVYFWRKNRPQQVLAKHYDDCDDAAYFDTPKDAVLACANYINSL